MNIRLALAAIDSWAMEPERLERMLGTLAAVADPSSDEMDDSGASFSIAGTVATIPVSGTLLKSGAADARMWGMDATGYDEIGAALDAANANPSVASIVLAIDSPGGQVSGCQALADKIAASPKAVQAHVSDLCASAAYWLASQCADITANRSALIGSIGVYAVVRDVSRMLDNVGIKTHVISSGGVKGAGASGAPITDAQLAEIKRTIDGQCAQFCEAISGGRGKSATEVAALADGRVHLSAQAQALGLIDHVANAPQVLPAMNIAPARLAALVKENKAHSDVILEMAVADKSEADILAHIKDANTSALVVKVDQVMAAHEALKAEHEAGKVQSAAAIDALKASHAAALAAKETELQAAKAAHAALAALANNGPNGKRIADPGEQHVADADLPKFTSEQARAGDIPEATLKSGKYQIVG